jgi:hypothetical protein
MSGVSVDRFSPRDAADYVEGLAAQLLTEHRELAGVARALRDQASMLRHLADHLDGL